MFKAEIDLDIFKEFILNLMIVVEEINLNITEKGFYSKAVDIANVSMIASNLNKEAFNLYILEKNESIRVGLDLLKINDMLSSSKDTVVQIEIDTNIQKIYIKYENFVYSTSLLDPSTIRSEPNVPNIEFSSQICINGLEFKKAIKLVERINDYVVLGLKNNVFYLEAKNETDNIYLSIESKVLMNEQDKSISSIYSIDYLLNLIKAIGKIENVKFSISQDYPLLVTFNLISNFGSVVYFLAPRIESE